MPNQIKIRPLKDKLRQFFSPIVYECSVFRNNGKPIGGFADENEISDAFSPTHSYVVGEPCIYENVVRICTTPHNGNWDASHFRSVSVMGYAQEVVKNLGMPPEYDPNYEYSIGDICTHNGLWYRSLYGYSGGGAGAWDETKWESDSALNEISKLSQLGYVNYDTFTASQSVGSAATRLLSLNVPAGLWIFHGEVRYALPKSRVFLRIGTSLNIATETQGTNSMYVASSNTQPLRMESNVILYLSQPSTVYLIGYADTTTSATHGALYGVRVGI